MAINLDGIKWYIKRRMLRDKIIKYYKNNTEKVDSEIGSILEYISKNRLQVFNYDFIYKYTSRNNDIYYDINNDLHYIVHSGKKMYFKRKMSKHEINEYYNSICMEQDIESPHLYLDDELKNNKYRVALDVGVAEGNFALSIIDQVDELYLFEVDSLWIEALEATFRPYKDKVHIVNKFVSNKDNENEVRLDTYFKDNKSIDLVKMDIEGAEVLALQGAKNILRNNDDIKLLVCTYHKESDEEKVREILCNYDISSSNGYMVFIYDDNLKEPYFRRGVLKANVRKQ